VTSRRSVRRPHAERRRDLRLTLTSRYQSRGGPAGPGGRHAQLRPAARSRWGKNVPQGHGRPAGFDPRARSFAVVVVHARARTTRSGPEEDEAAALRVPVAGPCGKVHVWRAGAGHPPPGGIGALNQVGGARRWCRSHDIVAGRARTCGRDRSRHQLTLRRAVQRRHRVTRRGSNAFLVHGGVGPAAPKGRVARELHYVDRAHPARPYPREHGLLDEKSTRSGDRAHDQIKISVEKVFGVKVTGSHDQPSRQAQPPRFGYGTRNRRPPCEVRGHRMTSSRTVSNGHP